MHLEDDMNAEENGGKKSRTRKEHWKRWGPYVSDRGVGNGARGLQRDWRGVEYFPHDHARSRAYRWNEDGLAAICDRHQFVCFGLRALERGGSHPQERLFGLTGNEGNHGEDVKGILLHLDSTPDDTPT